MKRSPRAKRPMTKRFLLPMMMFLKMIRHPVTMMKRHLHLRKRPSPSTKKLHLRKRPSTKKLHLRKRPSTRKLLLRKRPSTRKLLLSKRPSTRKLLLRKRTSTRKLLLRNLSQRTTLRMSTTMTVTARTMTMGRVQFLVATALIMIRVSKSIG